MVSHSGLPWILLLRDYNPLSPATYIERSLLRKFNLAVLRLDWSSIDLLRRISPSKIVKWFDRAYTVKLRILPPVEPDIIIVIDYVQKNMDLRAFKCPKVYYAYDNDLEYYHHIKDAKIAEYDYVFLAQKDWVEKYRELGCQNVFWLPHACDPEIHKRWNQVSKYDICFVGNIVRGSDRERLIQTLQNKFNIFVGQVYFHDLARIYSQSKIIFNRSNRGDLNMRIFEAMSCGSLLLTDKVANGLEDLFVNQKHLVLYEDCHDLLEKLNHLLSDDEERFRIAKEGEREVHSKHTYMHRVDFIMDKILRQV